MSAKRFPRSSLPEAIERAKKIYEIEATRPFSDEVAVKHMGYSGVSGASKTMLAALRGYGLITGRGADLRISQDAVVIIVDEYADDQTERREALLRCLQNNSLYADLFERFGNSASELNVAAYLQKTHGVNPSVAAATAASFKDSVSLVFRNGEEYDTSESNEKPAEAVSPAKPKEAGSPELAPPGANMRQETFTLEGSKSVTIQFPDQMSPEDYEDFKDWLAILERKVGRTVAKPSEPQQSESAEDWMK